MAMSERLTGIVHRDRVTLVIRSFHQLAACMWYAPLRNRHELTGNSDHVGPFGRISKAGENWWMIRWERSFDYRGRRIRD